MSDRTAPEHADTLRNDLRRAKERLFPGTWEKYRCRVSVDGKALDALLADVERLTDRIEQDREWRREFLERAEAAERERDEALGEAGLILVALGEPCAECGHIDWRADDERIDSYRNAMSAAESLAERYRAVVKADGHGSPSFHMDNCPGCAALRDEGGHS